MSVSHMPLSPPNVGDTTADLLGMPYDQLAHALDQWGVGRAQAKRVFRGLHVHQHPLSHIPSLGRHA